MPQVVGELAAEHAQRLQELQEALAKASQTAAPLTESNLELLSAVTAGVIAFTLLPGAAVALAALTPEVAVGVAAMATIAAISATLAAASSFVTATVLTMDVLGIGHVSESDRETTKLAGRYAGNAFTVTLGSIGLLVDGDYGFETGVTAGEFGGILMDSNDAIEAALKNEDVLLHLIQLQQELKEFGLAPHGEHVLSGQHIWADHLNAESMTKDLIEHPARTPKPAVILATDRPPARPSADNLAAQIKLERCVFTPPLDPTYSPVPVPAPAPAPATPSPRAPAPASPAPRPRASATPISPRTRGPWNTPLLPDYLGGAEPAQPSDPPLCSSAAIPDVTADDPDALTLPLL